MKKILVAVLLMLPLAAMAQQSIGIVDPIGALRGASEFQSRYDKLQDSLKDDKSRLEQLNSQVTQIRDRLDKEGMTMSEDDRQNLKTKGQQKMIELRNLQQSAQRKMGKGQEAILKVMEPKLKKAVDAVAEKHHLDLVVNAQAVVYAKDGMDITDEVSKQLNNMK